MKTALLLCIWLPLAPGAEPSADRDPGRSLWRVVSADSSETQAKPQEARNAIDGNPSTICTEMTPGALSGQFVLTNLGDGRLSIWNRWTNQMITLSARGNPQAAAEDVLNPSNGAWSFEAEGSR